MTAAILHTICTSLKSTDRSYLYAADSEGLSLVTFKQILGQTQPYKV